MKTIATIICLTVFGLTHLNAQEDGYFSIPGLKNFEGVWESNINGETFTLTLEIYIQEIAPGMRPKFDSIKGHYTYVRAGDTLSMSLPLDRHPSGITNGMLVNHRESDRELRFMFWDAVTKNGADGLLELLPGKKDEATFTLQRRETFILTKEDAERLARGFSVPQKLLMKKIR